MLNTYQDATKKIVQYLIIFASFSIVLPTAWMSVASGLILIFWIISGNYNEKFKRILDNPSAMSALIVFGFYIIGVFYSSVSFNESKVFLLKYQKLLLIPLVVSVIDSKKVRNYAFNAFLFGALILLLISYLKWLSIIPMDLGLHDLPDNSQGYLAFKNRIAHNILMSFFMYVAFSKFYFEQSRVKWVWFFLAALAFFDIMCLVGGRSGQIVALSFLVFLPLHLYGLKSIKYLFLFLMIIFLFRAQFEYLIPERLVNLKQEVLDHKSNDHLTSAGIRMEMYRNTFSLIMKSPLIGYGTGALRYEYKKLSDTQDTLLKDVPNPHNQFLLTFFELGILGLLIFIGMLFKQWFFSNNTRFIEGQVGLYAKGLILTISIGSLFNSLLLDATEGKFYCVLIGVLLSYNKKNE
jgi:O-antigen ligase